MFEDVVDLGEIIRTTLIVVLLHVKILRTIIYQSNMLLSYLEILTTFFTLDNKQC
jgi:hypothetical protein